MITQSFSLENFEFFLLILVRLASFFVVAPFYGMNSVPARTRAGLAGIISILVLYSIEPPEVTYSSSLGYGALVLKETVTGLLIGYSSNICSSIILFAGNMIDMNIGLSMASEFDPTLNTQITVTGNIYNYFFMLLFIVSDMYRYVFRALIDSFTVIPLGAAKMDFGKLSSVFLMYFLDLFVLGFRLTLPIFATIMILNTILGVMAKVAPQMNMFSVGVQIKVLVGMSILFVMVFLFPEACDLIFKETSKMLRAMVKGMT